MWVKLSISMFDMGHIAVNTWQWMLCWSQKQNEFINLLKLSGKRLQDKKSFCGVWPMLLMSKMCVTLCSERNNIEKNFIVIQVD